MATVILASASLAAPALATTVYVATNGTHIAPFNSWTTAARDIQSAVDAASSGDTILVTNGMYATGGRTAGGGASNRVVISKAVTVRSVNGPDVTVIAGQPCPATGGHGNGAIRGVYLSNGGTLAGFTITNGHTMAVVDHGSSKSSGGGVYVSGSCTVSDCILSGNTAYYSGGGVQGADVTVWNCVFEGNSATWGGGAYCGNYYNCVFRGNEAVRGGGAKYVAARNCTFVENTATECGGGIAYSSPENCILYYNTAPLSENHYLWDYTNCCTTPLPSGTGNITSEPGFVDLAGDDLRLSSTSACINAGVTRSWMSGATDMDGHPRVVGFSVDIGAYEYQPLDDPLTVEILADDLQAVVGYGVPLEGRVVGNAQGWAWRFGDGGGVANLLCVTNTYAATGLYEVTLTASNLAGAVTTTALVEIVETGYAYYVATNGHDSAAGTNWATAKQTLQDAVDAAGRGCVVWVSNGVYDVGGRPAAGYNLTNRVIVAKPLHLRSVNGPSVTFIAGAQNTGENIHGPAAVRGVYLADGAVLDGFTITNGHTRRSGSITRERGAGGVYCVSTSAVITNCVIRDCAAHYTGGGVVFGTIVNSVLQDNSARYSGGGAYKSDMNHCLIVSNYAASYGGGTYYGTLRNCIVRANRSGRSGGGLSGSYAESCTIVGNEAAESGGGAWSSASMMANCIVYYNQAPSDANVTGGGYTNCCITPLPASGTGNFTNAPGIVSVQAPRLVPGAACVDKGAFQSWMTDAVDWDGHPRIVGAAVDVGAYEFFSESTCTGELAAAISCAYDEAPAGFGIEFEGLITGRAQGYVWDFGDGARIANECVVSHAFEVSGLYEVTLTVSNLSGQVAVTTEVVILEQDCHLYVRPDGDDSAAGTNWATAFATIQTAVDAAGLGCTIWVSNGIYAAGGRAVQPGLTNRVALDKIVAVRSVNGPEVTFITGQPSLYTGGSGPGAIRCAYLASGATLDGFTLAYGYTLDSGTAEKRGGGIWCEGAGALITNCLVTGCGAAGEGGGGYNGTYVWSAFYDNRAASGGGVASATLTLCVLTNNRAGSGGGAYACDLNECWIVDNTATNRNGGGLYGGTATGCRLTGNKAANSGGGAYGTDLSGCTLQGNTAQGSLDSGGGAYGGTLRDCDLTGNTAPLGLGGGAASAIVLDSTMTSNSAMYGGALYYGTASNCLMRWNDAHYGGATYEGTIYLGRLFHNSATNGGGIFLGEAYDTTFSNNTALADGGGAYNATLHRCHLLNNTAGGTGGGARFGTLYSCVALRNTADYGGGVASAESHNCTFVNNEATFYGGGAFWGVAHNCIVYYNTAFASPNAYMGSFTNCCSTPLPDGAKNFTDAPRLTDYLNGDVRLLSNSPCIGAGTNAAWMIGARDPDGHHRIILNVVDTGAYEYTYPGEDHDGDGILTMYESGTGQFVGPEDSGTDPLNADTDGDGMMDGDEIAAGTDPLESSSFLGLVAPESTIVQGEWVIAWQSATGRVYCVERASNLLDGFHHTVESNIVATPMMNVTTDRVAVGTGPFFYRVRIE